MANSNIQQNLIPNEPTLKDLLDLFKKDLLLNFNCHHVGTVQSFNVNTQTAQVTVNYKKTFFLPNSSGQYEPQLIDYPVLLDCPVICLGGGSSSLTFPIQQGDECLILFNDRDLDNWFQGGAGSVLSTGRLHSFSDGIILVGLRSSGKVITNYNPTNAVLQNGSTQVSVGSSQAYMKTGQVQVQVSSSAAVLQNGTTQVNVGSSLIKIANNSQNLNTLLQNLLTQLQDLTTALSSLTVTGVLPGGGVSGVPVNAAAITSIGTQLSTIATDLGELLQ